MARLSSRLLRSAHGEPETPETISPHDVLPGLPPRLVIALARLAGSSLTDLSVTLRSFPYADRALLSAYKLTEMSPPTGKGGRQLTVSPFMVSLVTAAAELVAASTDEGAVAAVIEQRYHISDDLVVVGAEPSDGLIFVSFDEVLDDHGKPLVVLRTARPGTVSGMSWHQLTERFVGESPAFAIREIDVKELAGKHLMES